MKIVFVDEKEQQTWQFSVWVKKNKGNLRLIIAGMLGLLATTTQGLSPELAVTVGGIVTAISKLALDAFDYYFSH